MKNILAFDEYTDEWIPHCFVKTGKSKEVNFQFNKFNKDNFLKSMINSFKFIW